MAYKKRFTAAEKKAFAMGCKSGAKKQKASARRRRYYGR